METGTSKPKLATLLLIVALMASSLIMVKSASGIPKPSVPEFTVKYMDNSYSVPTTYSKDPYTGEEIPNPEHIADNRTIEVIIKNQAVSCMYNIRVKGHFAENWSEYGIFSPSDGLPYASGSEFTTLSFRSNDGKYYEGRYTARFYAPTGSQMDFQVMALVGDYEEQIYVIGRYYRFVGEKSDWSKTQTITIGESASNTTPPLEWKDIAIAVPGVVIAVLVLALVLSRKRSVRTALG